jgi:hypothetical protein
LLSWSRSSLPFVQSQGSLRFPQKTATSEHPDSATLVNHVYLKSNIISSDKRKQDFQIFKIKFFLRMPILLFLLGNSPSSEFYMPTFRNTVPSS